MLRRRMLMVNRFSVILNLDGVTLSAQPEYNKSYTATFSGTDSKTLLPNTVRIKMNEADITEDAFNPETNTIDISKVTGNIEISAKGAVIPQGFIPLQYIRDTNRTVNESSSKYKYLDTGFYPTNLTRIELDFNYVAVANNSGLLGIAAPDTTPRFYVIAKHGSYARGKIGWGDGECYEPDFDVISNRRQTLTFGKGSLTCIRATGAEITKTISSTLATPWTTGGTLKLGGFHESANLYRGTWIKLYGAKIYDNEVLVKDFVPLFRESDNFVGIYDLVNQVFITEKTTGGVEKCSWIRPYVDVTRALTNCTQSMVTTLLTSGNTSMAILNNTWTTKFTPSTGYTFNSENAVFSVIINGVDKTSEVATYDDTTDSWTVSLVGHWKDTISITATAV